MLERRFNDSFVQSELFDQTTPIVEESTSRIMTRQGIGEYQFLAEKVNIRFPVYIWRMIWDVYDLGPMKIGKQADICLRFTKDGQNEVKPIFAVKIRQRVRRQWRENYVLSTDLSQNSLDFLLRFAVCNPLRYSQFKQSPRHNLGCPAGCGASSDRLRA